MRFSTLRPRRATGSVRLVQRKRGPVFYAKLRLPDGHQVQTLLGPAHTGRGRPVDGFLTEKMAQDRLRELLVEAQRNTPARGAGDGHTFGDACDEWLRYIEHERQRRPSTVRDYFNVVRGSLLPELGADTPLAAITTQRIEDYRERLLSEGNLSRRTIQKVLVLLHGIMARAKRKEWIASNPCENVERVTVKRSGDFNVLAPAEVLAVARAATNEQDAAAFTVAAFTGLRLGELRALRWSDVDFERAMVRVRSSYTNGQAGPPKSGLVRSVPLIDHTARALDGLSRREHFTGADDLVFCSTTGGHRNDFELRRAFYAALAASGLRHLREKPDPIVFHDLRHTFGTLAVQAWPLHDVQGYMGHAHIQTTMLYVHHQPRTTAAAELTRLVEQSIGGAGETVSRTVSREVQN